MEFDPSFQRPQHLPFISRNHFLENPSFTQNMFSSQSSTTQSMFHHPNSSFNHVQQGNNKMMDASNHHKGKTILDFSLKTMVHQSDESSSFESSPSPTPFSLSNGYGCVRVSSEYPRDIDQRMQQQKMKHVMPENNTNIAGAKIINKGQWNEEEDSILVALVNKHGANKWSQIAKSLPNRIGKQCRERWFNHLRPNIKKDSWSTEEDIILIKAHQEVGNKWAEIAKRLPNRPENTIKNHWNTAKRRLNCRSHKRNQNSHYEGSMLYAYAKRVAAAEEAEKEQKKSEKNKKVPRSNYDDLALFLGYDHSS